MLESSIYCTLLLPASHEQIHIRARILLTGSSKSNTSDQEQPFGYVNASWQHWNVQNMSILLTSQSLLTHLVCPLFSKYRLCVNPPGFKTSRGSILKHSCVAKAEYRPSAILLNSRDLNYVSLRRGVIQRIVTNFFLRDEKIQYQHVQKLNFVSV